MREEFYPQISQIYADQKDYLQNDYKKNFIDRIILATDSHRADEPQPKELNAKDEKSQRRVLTSRLNGVTQASSLQWRRLQPRRLCYLKICKSVLYCKNGSDIQLLRYKAALTITKLDCSEISSWTHYHKKLTVIKLICKLLTNILLEIFKIINDHKKQENEGL